MRGTVGRLAVLWVVLAANVPVSASASDDTGFSNQWALPLIGAPAAWARTTGAGVRIGIVDTGVDLYHEDLAAKVVASASCAGSGGDPAACFGTGMDELGHGTHVAGIAAAVTDNRLGVAGVAPDAELVVAKVFRNGEANPADVTAGIRWVVDHGAKVVNLSLGDAVFVTTATLGTALTEGIDYAWSHGAVAVLSSGNEDVFGAGIGSSEYGDLNALVVGATGPDDRVAGYSSPTGNAKWAVVAPGGAGEIDDTDDIFSTFWQAGKRNRYAYRAGTSMAVPHVSGALALLFALGYDASGAVDRLLDTVDTRVSCGTGSPTCRGRLDVAAATSAG
jgi:serine protease